MGPMNQSFDTPVPAELERIATEIVDAIFRVHSKTGAGLLESVYVACLAYELTKRGLRVRREVVVPIQYDGIKLDEGFRIDLLVEEKIIIEVKAVDKLHPVFIAQTLTYLKLTNLRLAFLVNFNVAAIRQGIKRLIS